MFYNSSMIKQRIWLFEIVIWVLIFTAFFSLFIYKTGIKNSDKNTYYAFFDDVEGLVKGSPVRLMGVNAGYVDIVKIFDNKVFVAFKITKKNINIPQCAIATIEFYGLELNPAYNSVCQNSSFGIIPSKSYRIQDYWDGSALDSQVLIDIYGSFGRNVSNEDIIKYSPYVYQSKLIKQISEQTKSLNNTQTVFINKLTKETQKNLDNQIKNSETAENNEQ